MNKQILLSDETRKVAINNVFLQTVIFPQIIEKDLWVAAYIKENNTTNGGTISSKTILEVLPTSPTPQEW